MTCFCSDITPRMRLFELLRQQGLTVAEGTGKALGEADAARLLAQATQSLRRSEARVPPAPVRPAGARPVFSAWRVLTHPQAS